MRGAMRGWAWLTATSTGTARFAIIAAVETFAKKKKVSARERTVTLQR